MQDVIPIEFEKLELQLVEKERILQEHEKLIEQARKNFESLYKDNDEIAKISDKLTYFQALINEIQTIYNDDIETSTFYKINSIHEKTSFLIKKFQDLEENSKKIVSRKIFKELIDILTSCLLELQLIKQKLELIKKSFQEEICESSKSYVFEYWAIGLETLADIVANNSEIFTWKNLRDFKKIAEKGISFLKILKAKNKITQDSVKRITQKDHYKRRIKCASNYLIFLIEDLDPNIGFDKLFEKPQEQENQLEIDPEIKSIFKHTFNTLDSWDAKYTSL